jgi:hypothetical protein
MRLVARWGTPLAPCVCELPQSNPEQRPAA